MLNNHTYCIIMAGGIGSRFWPISRASKPKQFLKFASVGESFLRLSYDRAKSILPEENIIVVSLYQYRDLVLQEIPELKDENLFLEPYNRNTAPCIAYATYKLLKRDPLAVTVVCPADHAIEDVDKLYATVTNASAYAAGTNALITIGIKPTRPDCNFGYIQVAAKPKAGSPVKIKTFTEKPDVEIAKVFLETGEFLWNSGIFTWRASVIIEELEKYAPDITKLFTGWEEYLDTENEKSFIERIYSDMPRLSIDYAVMENTDHAWVYPASFKWADIGNWQSLYDYLAYHDENGNATNIQGDHNYKDCKNSIIYSKNSHKLLALRGLEDFLVIDTPDVLMICPRDEEKLRDLLSSLAMPEFEEYR